MLSETRTSRWSASLPILRSELSEKRRSMRPARLRQSTHVGVGVVLLGLSAVVVVVHTSGPTAALVIVGASIGSAALYLAGSSAAASPETAPGTEQQ